MMQEIYQRGPISCGIATPDAFEEYTGGIYYDKTGDIDVTHIISVVGFGVEDGVKYWVGRNSWGTWWGESGYFRIIRGVNNIDIEAACSWAVPTDTWTNPWIHHTTEAEKNDLNNDLVNSNYLASEAPDTVPTLEFLKPIPTHKKIGGRFKKSVFKQGEKITAPRPWEVLKTEDIPAEWDWRNVNGISYLSWTRTQETPVWCGSCWALAATGSIADRFNILQKDLPSAWVGISEQMILNCKLGGDC